MRYYWYVDIIHIAYLNKLNNNMHNSSYYSYSDNIAKF